MSLIDADKMLKRIESWNTSDAMDKALYNFTLNRIVEQPTVDAIPVSFIESEIKRMDDDINTAMNDGEPEWAERSITRRTTLQMLVEMWRLKRKEE